jgi:hypothetical protein
MDKVCGGRTGRLNFANANSTTRQDHKPVPSSSHLQLIFAKLEAFLKLCTCHRRLHLDVIINYPFARPPKLKIDFCGFSEAVSAILHRT